MKRIFTFLFMVFAFALQAQDFSPAMNYFSSENFDDESNYEIIDFDADGDLDIIGGDDATVYLNDGMNNFSTEIFLVDDEFRVTGDFNGDNQMDVVTEDSLVINNGDGTFTVTALIEKDFHLTGDFNNDGFDDLVTWETQSTNVRLYISFGNADGTLTSPAQISSGDLSVMAVEGDFNGDNNLDLAFIKNNSTIEVLTNNGDGTFASEQFDTEESHHYLNTGDFDSDGDLDLVWGARNTSNIGWALNDGGSFGSTQLETLVDFGPIERAQGIAVADYNGDGFPDFFVSAGFSSDSGNKYFANEGGTGFADFASLPGLGTDGFLEYENLTRTTAFDYDGDGDMDVVVHSRTEIKLFINEGSTATFEENSSMDFSIFPNPFAESIRVEAEELIGESVLLQLTDITGRLVLSQKGQLPMNLELTSLVTQGNYILTVHSQETSALLATGKLLKSK
jgi:hypothetical protein